MLRKVVFRKYFTRMRFSRTLIIAAFTIMLLVPLYSASAENADGAWAEANLKDNIRDQLRKGGEVSLKLCGTTVHLKGPRGPKGTEFEIPSACSSMGKSTSASDEAPKRQESPWWKRILEGAMEFVGVGGSSAQVKNDHEKYGDRLEGKEGSGNQYAPALPAERVTYSKDGSSSSGASTSSGSGALGNNLPWDSTFPAERAEIADLLQQIEAFEERGSDPEIIRVFKNLLKQKQEELLQKLQGSTGSPQNLNGLEFSLKCPPPELTTHRVRIHHYNLRC